MQVFLSHSQTLLHMSSRLKTPRLSGRIKNEVVGKRNELLKPAAEPERYNLIRKVA